MVRVQLVKLIIHDLLVYSFHVYRWLIKLLSMLDRWIKNFDWSGDKGSFLGCFAANLREVTVYEAKLTDLILAMEFSAQFSWRMIWLVTDSSSAVLAFKNQDLIPF
jgi:hypothetical protein